MRGVFIHLYLECLYVNYSGLDFCDGKTYQVSRANIARYRCPEVIASKYESESGRVRWIASGNFHIGNIIPDRYVGMPALAGFNFHFVFHNISIAKKKILS